MNTVKRTVRQQQFEHKFAKEISRSQTPDNLDGYRATAAGGEHHVLKSPTI